MARGIYGRSWIIAALAGLALPTAGWAQTPEAEALGVQVAHSMFQAIAFDALIAKEMKGASDAFADIKSRPEWGGMLEAAMSEEIRHDMPEFERLLGHVLAQNMSVDELKAGAAIMSDPATQAIIAASSTGATKPAPDLKRENARIANSAAGRGFLRKFEKLETYMAPIQDDMVAEIMPGAFHRFADKMEAGEAARKAAAKR